MVRVHSCLPAFFLDKALVGKPGIDPGQSGFVASRLMTLSRLVLHRCVVLISRRWCNLYVAGWDLVLRHTFRECMNMFLA